MQIVSIASDILKVGKSVLSMMIRNNKPNIKMIFDIANFYKNSKNYEKAIEYYTKIISLLIDNFLGHLS